MCLLGAVLLPALIAAVLPNAQAQDTVYVAADTDQSTAASESTTSATQPSTTATEPETTSSHTTSTTTKRKATTTTTAKPKSTTTTAPKSAQAVVPAPAPVATKPAPSVGPPTGSGATAAEASFLACVRQRESGGNYSVVSSNGLWYGAYQMTRSTWDMAAQKAGRGDLVGVPPNVASPADQDYLALVLYRWLGKSPWGGAC